LPDEAAGASDDALADVEDVVVLFEEAAGVVELLEVETSSVDESAVVLSVLILSLILLIS
jgi:hypothetical protein